MKTMPQSVVQNFKYAYCRHFSSPDVLFIVELEEIIMIRQFNCLTEETYTKYQWEHYNHLNENNGCYFLKNHFIGRFELY